MNSLGDEPQNEEQSTPIINSIGNLSDDDFLKVYQHSQVEMLTKKRATLFRKKLPDLRQDSWYVPKIEIIQSNTTDNSNGNSNECCCCSVSCASLDHIKITIRRLCCTSYDLIISSIRPASLLLRLCFIALLWLFCWLAFPPSLSLPGGAIFDSAATFLFTYFTGGLLGRIFGMPPLVFTFLMGILWGNVAGGNLSAGIPPALRTFVSRSALTVILLRSGLAMSWKTIQPAAGTIIAMSVLPLLVEVIVHGFMAKALLYDDAGSDTGSNGGSSSIWPFVQSMTASPSASAIVGATMLDMRERGYFVRRGCGIIVVPSVILDFTIGVWGINFVVQLLLSNSSSSGDLAWQIIQGPLQLFCGIVGGIVLGYVYVNFIVKVLFGESSIKERDGKKENDNDDDDDFSYGIVLSRVSWHALFILCLMGGVCVFLGYTFNFAGGGCLACCFLACTAQHLMTKEQHTEEVRKQQQEGEEERGEKEEGTGNQNQQELQQHHQREAGNGNQEQPTVTVTVIVPGSPLKLKLVKDFLSDQLARLWSWIFVAALFGLSGAAIKLSTMFAPDFLGRALACLFVGACSRIVVCTVCTWSFPMTKSERIISMIATAGRGSAQVALGSLALTRVQDRVNSASEFEMIANGNFTTSLKYGRQVYDCAELGVILLGSMSITLISRVGPCFWLTDDEYDAAQEKKRATERNDEDESGKNDEKEK